MAATSESSQGSSSDEEQHYTRFLHPHLNAHPCGSDGSFLKKPFHAPAQRSPPDATEGNPWAPFEDRLAFEWAHERYVKLKTSAKQIGRGLELWQATLLKGGSTDTVPWKSAKELYATIDSIQAGSAPWTTHTFQYNGLKPAGIVPAWMTEMYELNVRNVLHVLEGQLADEEFDGRCDYTPYKEFNPQGDRVWSNLMSGEWAYQEADEIAKLPGTRGAMLIPVVSGSDKTTVSVATGHQEFHPLYVSPGNISNSARRGHGMGILPFAFLPIPKVSKLQRKNPLFQSFTRQLYHACLEFAFAPLKPYMTTPKIVLCPDGYYRRAIFSLGPYIADYPEQVWLLCIVSNWCCKCDAKPNNLDNPESHRRCHEKTDFMIKNFDPGILWSEYGLRNDVVPFTHSFPRADIHLLLAPDLLHQLIKGVFKDHLVTWVCSYFHLSHGEKGALEIIEDIDHRISVVPAFPGLRRFHDGRDFNQWTGDDSKALMKIYLAAVAGYLPRAMVRCISAFINACYIARRNALDTRSLQQFTNFVCDFHKLRNIFIQAGVRADISLPRQHALTHYAYLIRLFGSPNGLCSSITESKHIKAVKEPWRRSSRFKALAQMLHAIVRMEKMAVLRRTFNHLGMLKTSLASNIMESLVKPEVKSEASFGSDMDIDSDSDLEDITATAGPPGLQDASTNETADEIEPVSGDKSLLGGAISNVKLASTRQFNYPFRVEELAQRINQPGLQSALARFRYFMKHPTAKTAPEDLSLYEFLGHIQVYHSAKAIFYAPSDLCGSGGLCRETIYSTPYFRGGSRRDTIFVERDGDKLGMEGMDVARVQLFFSFSTERKTYSCALINWYLHDWDSGPDEDTGMWEVELEHVDGCSPVEVISLDSIVRGAHLLPIYGQSVVPPRFKYFETLDSYQSFFVNHFVDHHAHELIVT